MRRGNGIYWLICAVVWLLLFAALVVVAVAGYGLWTLLV